MLLHSTPLRSGSSSARSTSLLLLHTPSGTTAPAASATAGICLLLPHLFRSPDPASADPASPVESPMVCIRLLLRSGSARSALPTPPCSDPPTPSSAPLPSLLRCTPTPSSIHLPPPSRSHLSLRSSGSLLPDSLRSPLPLPGTSRPLLIPDRTGPGS